MVFDYDYRIYSKRSGFAVTTDASRIHATFVKVAKTTDIPVGEMKHFEVDGLSV